MTHPSVRPVLPASGSRCCSSLCGNRLNWFPGRYHKTWTMKAHCHPSIYVLYQGLQRRNSSSSSRRWGAEWIPIIINWEVSWNHFIIVHHSDLALLAIHYNVDVPLVCYYYSGVIALRWWLLEKKTNCHQKAKSRRPSSGFIQSRNIKLRCP